MIWFRGLTISTHWPESPLQNLALSLIHEQVNLAYAIILSNIRKMVRGLIVTAKREESVVSPSPSEEVVYMCSNTQVSDNHNIGFRLNGPDKSVQTTIQWNLRCIHDIVCQVSSSRVIWIVVRIRPWPNPNQATSSPLLKTWFISSF